MGFLTNIISATVKTALAPIAVIKDAANIVTGKDANSTKRLLRSAGDDVNDAFDDLGDADLL